MSFSAASPSIVKRIGAFIRRAATGLASRVRRVPGMRMFGNAQSPGTTPVTVSECVAEFGLKSRCDRILALMARIQAGEFRLPQLRTPRAPYADGSLRVQSMLLRCRPTPRAPGWLGATTQDGQSYGEVLVELLHEPGMQAMCLATPRMGQLFAPLLRALGETLPHWIPRAETRRPARPFQSQRLRVWTATPQDPEESVVPPFFRLCAPNQRSRVANAGTRPFLFALPPVGWMTPAAPTVWTLPGLFFRACPAVKNCAHFVTAS